MDAEDTGPTSRSHRSSTLRFRFVAKAVGFATWLPLKVVTEGYVPKRADVFVYCANAELTNSRAPILTAAIFLVWRLLKTEVP